MRISWSGTIANLKRLLAATMLLAIAFGTSWADLSPDRIQELIEAAGKGSPTARASLEAELLRLKGLSAAGYLEPAGGLRLYRLHQALKDMPAPGRVPTPPPGKTSSPKTKTPPEPDPPGRVRPSADSMVVRKVTFVAYRTDHETLRKHFPVKVGDTLTAKTLFQAKESLLRMRMFKEVSVYAVPMEGGGAEVKVEVKDGWYILPIPFFFGGSGGSRGGAFFTARNVFRRAEAFSLVALVGSEATRMSFSAEHEGYALNVSYEKHDFHERGYADGGFSSSQGLGEAPDASDPGKLGNITQLYLKGVREVEYSLELPLVRDKGYYPWLSTELGYEESIVRYETRLGRNPGDAGTLGQYFVRLKILSQGGIGAELGQILGYGLADLETRIKPLRRTRFNNPMSMTGFLDTRFSKKSFRYRKLVLRWDPSVSWGKHNVAAAYFVGARGVNIQPYRLPTTSMGLQGSYAREYRAQAVLGGGLRLSKPFLASKWGVLRATAFAEKGRAFTQGRHLDQAGFGGSLYYIFWRLPLPLGLSYTYSINDKNTQITAALGGAF